MIINASVDTNIIQFDAVNILFFCMVYFVRIFIETKMDHIIANYENCYIFVIFGMFNIDIISIFSPFLTNNNDNSGIEINDLSTTNNDTKTESESKHDHDYEYEHQATVADFYNNEMLYQNIMNLRIKNSFANFYVL